MNDSDSVFCSELFVCPETVVPGVPLANVTVASE